MLRHRTKAFVCAGLVAAAAACDRAGTPPAIVLAPGRADSTVRELADAYLEGFFERNPDQITLYGVPGRHHDALPDNGSDALRAWQAKEDAWLAQAKQIAPATIEAAPLRATYASVRETLEGSVGKRVCRDEWWNVSQMTGWQVNYGYLVTIQPVGSDEARHEALVRWSRLPHYIDTEIVNLREGLKAGYSAPRGSVRIVIDTEGWALYSERLADEMKLFSADLDRLGMLSSQALRAVRLVVDSGIHTLGWTRQQAIDYMLAHTAEDRDDVVSEVDRYIIYPGQATAYMLGKLEISKAREEAQHAMGQTFDIKTFHDRVLEDGAVPVSFLHEKIRQWAAR